MFLATRMLSLAILGVAIAPAFGQSSSTAEMGAAGASGGVRGGSAAAGAQGPGTSGAADGGGPNLSPVVPSGSRSATFGNGGQPTNGNVNTMGQRPSARQRFGNSPSVRGNMQSADSTGLFAPGAQAFDSGGANAVRPNRTYRSDLGAWQVVGPFQAGSSTNVFPNNGMVTSGVGQYGAPNTGYGYYDSTLNNGANFGSSVQTFGGVAANGAWIQPQGQQASPTSIAPRGVGLSNSLAPMPGNANVPASTEAASYAAPPSESIPVRATLGINMAEGFTGSGARVSRVAQKSPAARAGLRRGDVITSLNGMGVYSHQDVIAAMQDIPANSSAEVIVWRRGQSIPLTIHFADRPQSTSSTGFDPARTSASSATDQRLARVEALMNAAQAELEQLRADDDAR
jgi:hypothetical protein